MNKPIRLTQENNRYPESVKVILKEKAPSHIDYIGNIDILNNKSIGVTGSRKVSKEGVKFLKDFIKETAFKNYTFVSGDAIGVDFTTHHSSLVNDLKTILVLPYGINHFKIRRAYMNVWNWDNVLVVSQFEENKPWSPSNAMIRNRLIIGLSGVMLAFEAGKIGGTYNACKDALKLKRKLLLAKYDGVDWSKTANQQLLDLGAKILINKTEGK